LASFSKKNVTNYYTEPFFCLETAQDSDLAHFWRMEKLSEIKPQGKTGQK
jgi:hypothetical protein